MTTQQLFVPYAESKSAEERIAYVKANPLKYKSKSQYDFDKRLEAKMDEILSKLTALEVK
jgi:hypothetical protein|tara:strand:+ start:640 stop:819 length:180 start_codon:yes stop_codon:yes gene_type:complete